MTFLPYLIGFLQSSAAVVYLYNKEYRLAIVPWHGSSEEK